MVESWSGRATDRTRGSQILPNSDKLRMGYDIHGSEGWGAKVPVREGNNPEHQLRSQNICQVELRGSDCRDRQDVSLEAAIHLKSA